MNYLYITKVRQDMKRTCFIFSILLTMTMCANTPKGQKVLIETSMGNITLVLYNETPLHRNNFVKLVQENYYQDLTFHRVIKGFMIQAGDPKSASDSTTNKFDKENVVAPEFRTPRYFHMAGALAAARWGDDENPQKLSNAFQFYIVGGKKRFDFDLQNLEKERFERLKQGIYQALQAQAMDSIKAMYKEGNRAGMQELKASILQKAEEEAAARKSEILFTSEQREIYTSIGGAPHLDGEYTVFGEVIEGLDIVKKIEAVDTNANDKPLTAVVIKKISLID